MKRAFPFCVAALLALNGFSAAAAQLQKERELIQDNHFQRGFILWKPEPGKHVRYGELKGFDSKAKPVWGLSQWSSKFPLANLVVGKSEAVLVYSNSAKAITMGASRTTRADLSMALNADAEYDDHARQAGDPWVHLLVEQEFNPPAALHDLRMAKLHVEARLLRSRNLREVDYRPDVHAAQFQIFFTVQNRNRNSPGFGDALWFGIPIYDNRHRFIPEFKQQDFGGTARFIFTPDGNTFASTSTHDGEWVTIEKDLLPLMHEALATAWARGFLKESKDSGDYSIGGMNMGWELPGTFEVEMQVRNLSLKVNQRGP